MSYSYNWHRVGRSAITLSPLAMLQAAREFNERYEEAQKLRGPLSDQDREWLKERAKNQFSWTFKLIADWAAQFDIEVTWPPTLAHTQYLLEGKLALGQYLARLEDCKTSVQALLDSLAPFRFKYLGFTIRNPDSIPEQACFKMLDGVEHLVGLFRRRGLEHLLRDSIRTVALHTTLSGRASGTYSEGKREIELSWQDTADQGSRFDLTWIHEVFLHEFGHYVHLSYITPEARREWDSGWDAVNALKQETKAREKAIRDITKADRQRFFDLIEKSGYNVARAAKHLRGAADRVRYAVWLRHPIEGGEPFITANRLQLTRSGKLVFDFFKDPDNITAREHGIPIGHERFDEAKLKSIWRRKVWLGLDWDGSVEVPQEYVVELAKQDPVISNAVEDLLAKLEIVSPYGKTNETEDFAETFVAFMAAPQKLTPNAKFRMQRALFVSSFHGKPVMRLAKTAPNVLARFKAANLQPPLGEPGGPCQVVQRIRREVPSKSTQQRLIQDVEHGQELSNPEAASIYQVSRESGAGFVKQILISPHAQYRMDLRSVTVEDVQAALLDFNQWLLRLKTQNPSQYKHVTTDLQYGEKIRHRSHRGLTIVFTVKTSGATLITCFWAGVEDPTVPPQGCRIVNAAESLHPRLLAALEGHFEHNQPLRGWALSQLRTLLQSGGSPYVHEPRVSVVYRGATVTPQWCRRHGIDPNAPGPQRVQLTLGRDKAVSWSASARIAQRYWTVDARDVRNCLFHASVQHNRGVFAAGPSGLYLVAGRRQSLDREMVALYPVTVDTVTVRQPNNGFPV